MRELISWDEKWWRARSVSGIALVFTGIASIYMTANIGVTIALLPNEPSLILPIVALLLGLSYVSVIFMVIAPRLLVRTISVAARERELGTIQRRIDDLWPGVLEARDRASVEFAHLMKVHESLARSSVGAFGVGAALGQIVTGVLLPTSVAVFSAQVQQLLR